jgi:hypothetical protein
MLQLLQVRARADLFNRKLADIGRGEPDKTLRLQELSDLVVLVDRVDESCKDRLNTLKQENVHEGVRDDDVDAENDERRNTPSTQRHRADRLSFVA